MKQYFFAIMIAESSAQTVYYSGTLKAEDGPSAYSSIINEYKTRHPGKDVIITALNLL